MAADFSIKAHDTLPSFQAQLGLAGVPGGVSLVGTSVKFVLRLKDASGPPKVAKPAVIVDPVNGVVRYDWDPADTADKGSYTAEWEVTYSTGGKRTFPTLTYHTVDILADLDGV